MGKSVNSTNSIVVKDLHKSYKDLKVLDGVSFSVKKGDILALLGPNGAGKTTTVKILSTLLHPDKGEAQINGYDIKSDEAAVRSNIGLTGQYAAVDEYLTGEENLKLIGRLYRLNKDDVNRRSKQLLEQFDLVEASTRPVKTYSGGMRRRLDLAMSLIASPPVIFLDEPTTGLDPRSRLTMWAMIEKLASGGTTILLTTQYMEEADYLADNIVVIDNGKVIAEGTSDTLKSKVGSDRLELKIAKNSSLEKAEKIIDGKVLNVDKDDRIISIATKKGAGELRRILEQLEKAKIDVVDVSLHRPTLDDVFLSLTGKVTSEEEKESKK
ncbi:ATP-binding cassette domain-containing protein [Candidatus Saccharibacteria bacterium]|nr:ATP-binding cassette domain-containing protein [Candidatus Saccharibacteria bacterium]